MKSVKSALSGVVAITVIATIFSGLFAIYTVSAAPDSGRTYLFYEDFNDMTDGAFPNGMSCIRSDYAPTITKTTVNAGNGDYAMKFTPTGDNVNSTLTGLAIRLNDIVECKGVDGADDHSDRITIEYDLKNEHGAFGLSWLTSEEVAAGYTAKVQRKKVLFVGGTDGNYRMWPLPNGTNGAWTGHYNATGSTGVANMVSGDTAFTSFGKWVHITMVLDGEKIDTTRQYRHMYAEVSWYEKDNPSTVHRAYYSGNDGRGMYIESPAGASPDLLSSDNLNGYRQKDIASVVLPIFYYDTTNKGVPTIEIDNMEIYLTNKASTPSPAAFEVTNVGGVAGTSDIKVSFDKQIGNNIADYIGLQNSDGTDIAIDSVTVAADEMSLTVSPASGQSLSEYITLSIDKYATAKDGGILLSKYECTVRSPKRYLFYEDFNDMTSGTLPSGITCINSTYQGTVTKTTIDAGSGDYAMKFTPTGSNSGTVTGLAMRLNDVIVGKGVPDANDHSDRITIEYDLKNEHGAFGLSWFTSEEVAAGGTESVGKVWRKKPIFMGTPDQYHRMWPISTGNGEWTGRGDPTDAAGGSGVIQGDTTFSSFGEWVHITMILDPERVDNDHNYRAMYAEVSWYEKDTPGTVYRAYTTANSGRGLYIDNTGGSYVSSHLNGYSQKNIASIVLPMFYYDTGSRGVPTIEIDNMEIYLTNGTSSATYAGIDSVTFANSSSSGLSEAPALTTGITVNFGTAMPSNVGKYITLTCNGTEVPATGALTNGGLTYTITPNTALSPLTDYVLTVDDNAVALSGDKLAREYVKAFKTDRGLKVTAFNITNGSSAIDAVPSAGTNLNLSVTTNNDCTVGAWLFLAEYQGTELKKFNSKYVEMPSGVSTNTLTSNINMISGVDTIKAFIWDAEYASIYDPITLSE